MIDIQQALDNFSSNGGSNTNDAITAIYNILPSYTAKQQKLLFLVSYYINKWELDDIEKLINECKAMKNKNKNLGMLQQQSLKSLLSAYTQNEMIRGIKPSVMQNVTEDK